MEILKSQQDIFDSRKRMKKIAGNINSRNILGERRQNQRREKGGRKQSEAILTVCGGDSLWFD